MTPYNESRMNEPDFIKKDAVISSIIDKYYASDDTTTYEISDTDDESGTVFYSSTDEIPNSFDGTETW